MIFDAEELTELATCPGDRALRALDAGDTASALAIAEASVNAHFPIRDIYTTWNTLTIAYLARELGVEAATEALRESLRPLLRPLVENFRNGATREAVTVLAQFFRMDAGQLASVDEDHNRIVLTADDWAGSRAAALGVPGMLPTAEVLAIVHGLAVEWMGYPPFVIQPTSPGALTVTIHKDPLDVPPEVFGQYGTHRDTERIGAAFSTAGAHLFDADERDDLCDQALVLAGRAIKDGDLDRARRHFALSRSEWYPAHHFGRDVVTALLSWLHEHHGVERTWDCVEVAYNKPIMGQMGAQVDGLDMRSKVEMLGGMFHQHGMKFSIVESEGGFDFRTAPCGSGGRLIEEGAYAAPKDFATVTGPSVASFGLDEMPVYCMHCPATNKMFLENDGPYFLLVEPDVHDGRIRGHCSFHVFKNPAAVPDEMYERVGLLRPT